jgi:hypothetical protein
MSRLRRPLRLLRVLLACLALCVSAAPALAEAVWTESAVTVSGAAPPRSEQRAIRVAPRSVAHAFVAPPLAAHSLEPTQRPLLATDIYLKNCALLR